MNENLALTENGAVSYGSTLSACLDLFAVIGALRDASDEAIRQRFDPAFREDPAAALRILFFARDIRGGLGERRVFRVILRHLALTAPERLQKLIPLIPEYGRYDDLLTLLGTPCEARAVELIRQQLEQDLRDPPHCSLLAKWLPSVNASSPDTVRCAGYLAGKLGMTRADYRRSLSGLRKQLGLLENHLRQRDYSFDYEKQPGRALYKYRAAFDRNDAFRYRAFLQRVRRGEAVMHTGTLLPYEIIAPCFRGWRVSQLPSEAERQVMDTTWNALEDFGGEENALAVIDGSVSMYMPENALPAAAALSLGIYFAERSRGPFHNRFITFSREPQLVEITGRDIAEKVQTCAAFREPANTDLQKVFRLLLDTALSTGAPREALPRRLYLISDMEFDRCVEQADCSNFEAARKLFAAHGCELPEIVFWKVAGRTVQQPVTKNEQGVILVSGFSPRLFTLVAGGAVSPYGAMLEILNSDRYAPISLS